MGDNDKKPVKGERFDTEAYAKSQGRKPATSPLGGLDSTPLSERKAKPVGKRGRRRRGQAQGGAAPFDMGAYLTAQQASQQQGMQGILDAYSKGQQRQPMIRRDMSGQIVDQNKAPEGMDFFKKNNPFTEDSLQRQRNVNAQNAYQRALGVQEGRMAVEAKKSEQAAMGFNDPNQVMSKTINGQKFVFDKQGNPVGMTGDTGVSEKLENGSLATPEARAQNRQGIESAFLSQMTKGQAKQFVGGPMQPAIPGFSGVESKNVAQQSQPWRLPALPELPQGVSGQLSEATPSSFMSASATPEQAPAFNPAAAAGVPNISFADLANGLNANNPEAWINDPLGIVKRKKANAMQPTEAIQTQPDTLTFMQKLFPQF